MPFGSRPPSRAGALDVSALLFAALFPTLGAWLYFFLFTSGWPFHAAYLGSKAIQFTLPLVGLLVSGAPPRSGDPAHVGRAGVLALTGLAWGLAMAAVIGASYVLILRGGAVATEASVRVTEKLDGIGAAALPRYVVLAVFISVIHSWLEEYYWRWFLFAQMRARMAPGSAALLSSLAFASHHVVVLGAYLGSGPGAWWIAPLSAGVVAGGLVWAGLYARSGTILPGWISHVVVDLAIMAVGWDLARAAGLVE